MRIYILLVIAFAFITVSCNSQEKNRDATDMQEQLTRMNQARVGNESKRIDAFVAQKGFNVKRTGTGLRYEIYQKGTGPSPVEHEQVELKYKVFLLDGTLCYSSDSSGNAKFRIGEGQQIRGVEEAVTLMRVGDKAHLVLPSHLAYGMGGDEHRIPPMSPVYFDIELLNVKK